MDTKTDIINEDKVIISPKENIDFSNSQELKEDLLEVFNDGYKNIVLDFGEIENIDSSGLGKLLLFHKKLKEDDGKIIIQNIQSDYIKNMFEMINLHTIIEIEE